MSRAQRSRHRPPSRCLSIGAVGVAALLIWTGCTSGDRNAPSAAADRPEVTHSDGTPSNADRSDSHNPSRATSKSPDLNGLKFTEVGQSAGLTETQSDLTLAGDMGMTSGAAVADIDGDGDMDMFIPRVGKPNSLYLNDGFGTFTDVARAVGVAGPEQRYGSAAGVFFDADGDGDMDLFALGAGLGENQMFINNGTGRFVDETATRGFSWPAVDDKEFGSQQHGVSVADVNGDGYLDLLVLQWYIQVFNSTSMEKVGSADGWADEGDRDICKLSGALSANGFTREPGAPLSRSGLWLNDGTGHFVDATEKLGLPMSQIVAFTGAFGDIDGDGWQDLLITGDSCTSRLFRNVNGEEFEDITGPAKVGTDENGMGAVVRDVNHDGRADIFITSVSHPLGRNCPLSGLTGCSGNRLYLNNGDGTFRDATDKFGLRVGHWGWGAAIEDFGNDGRLGVVMTNGYDVPNSPDLAQYVDDPTAFWLLGGRVHRDAAADIGLDDNTIGHGLVPFDMDGDGDLDLLITPSGERPRLYRNDTPKDRAWLTVSLVDPTRPGNRWGDGARVEVRLDESRDPVVGWITTSGSYESQRPPEFHVGLGTRSRPVASVKVFWPGGGEPQVLTDLEPNQRLTIVRDVG